MEDDDFTENFEKYWYKILEFITNEKNKNWDIIILDLFLCLDQPHDLNKKLKNYNNIFF